MHKKLTMVLILAGTLIVVGLAYVATTNKKAPSSITLYKDDVSLIKTLKAPDGAILGDLTVTHFNTLPKDPEVLNELGNDHVRNLDGAFDSLYVVKEINEKKTILYKVTREGFSNILGTEMEFANDKFYGFQFSAVFDDYFVLHGLANNGREISDDVTVKWNYEKNIFEISLVTEKDIQEANKFEFVSLGALYSSDGQEIGKMEGTYLDENTNILSSLIIRKENSLGSIGLFASNKDIFSSVGGRDGRPMREDFYGFKIIVVKKDYFVLHLLPKDEKNISSDITVKWNENKAVFETLKVE